jgi:hypothetical protein
LQDFCNLFAPSRVAACQILSNWRERGKLPSNPAVADCDVPLVEVGLNTENETSYANKKYFGSYSS